MKTPAQLRIPQAFAFTPPRPTNSTFGRWVVYYMRERFTYSANDHAFFWRKADAMAFYKANKNN